MSKKHIFLSIFSKIIISACVFCAFFILPVFATLPAGYTELEYIESTGTQYIDTETRMKSSTDVITFTGVVAYNTFSGRNFIAAIDRDTNSHYIEFTDNYFGQKPAGTRWDIKLPNDELNAGQPYEIGLQINGGISTKCSIVVDGVKHEKITTQYQKLDTASNFVIGKLGSFYSRAKFYTASIVLNDTLIRNLIPARRNSDGEIGMYDMVSGTFFTNQGKGDFIAGPVAEIKIATTKFVDEEFKAAELKLAETVETIEEVVSNTITQTEQIATLQSEKQTRPDESCPANMKCLLVQDEDGTPHWYPIIEP